MNKKNFVFWRKLSGDEVADNFSAKPEYLQFFSNCSERFNFRIANNKESYKGGGIFENVCRYENWKIVPAEKEFKADFVYQRMNLADKTFDKAVPLVDSIEFKAWCPDKWNQYELLKEFMPESFLIMTEQDYVDQLSLVKTDKAVIKPRRGQEGKDITVFDKKNPPKLNSEILTKKGYILQEYCDTDVDMQGVVNGIHDIKLITIDDSVFANLRTPEIDKQYCTYDSPYTEIPLSKLPKEVLEMHKRVKAKVDSLHPNQLYTVDVGMTKNGPIVFELNSHTAFPYTHFAYADDFIQAFMKHMENLSQ